MTEDTPSIIQTVLEDAVIETKLLDLAVKEKMKMYLEDGTLLGSKTGRIKKMADSMLMIIRREALIEDK